MERNVENVEGVDLHEFFPIYDEVRNVVGILG